MLWLLAKMCTGKNWPSKKQLVLACCDCAEPALQYVAKDETRPAEAIRIARAWANGKATLAQVRAAANAAYAAVYSAVYAAFAAANAANAAAYAAYVAADAVYVAAYAANVAAYVANVAAYAAARAQSLKTSADICRKHFQVESQGTD
jgi:hypothetical protein